MNFSSKLLETAVLQFSQLPGIGKRSALRIVLHLLKQSSESNTKFSNLILELQTNIKSCTSCFNISDFEICEICSNSKRLHSLLCVVEDVKDVMAIENTLQFHGIYHVLGGKINPMEGIGPNQLQISSLVDKINSGKVNEVVFALNSSIESDTTVFYIVKQIQNISITLSSLSRGIAIGDELEYTDEVTLGNSILNRVPLNLMLKNELI